MPFCVIFIGAKNRKPPLSRNWWILIHIFGHFWNALGKGYKAPEICGLKFKNGGDTARGGEKRKTATLSKLMKFGPHFGHYPKALWQGYKKPEIVGQSSKMAELWRWGRKTENPHFLETDELWSTDFDTFEKSSCRPTRRQKFVGQISITAEI